MTISQRPATANNEGTVGITNAAPASGDLRTLMPAHRPAHTGEVL